MNRPLIGISCNFDPAPTVGTVTHRGGDDQQWVFLATDYMNAIEKAGGIPVLLPQCRDFETVRQLADRLDGLVLSGGNDLDPVRYGEENLYSKDLVPARDQQDLALAQYALRQTKLPVLGICRGLQVLNVALGGTLWQDLPAQRDVRHSLSQELHPVSLEEGPLRDIFGAERLQVNSYHHQAVKDPAPGARVAATAPDGTVEALRFANHRFAMGIQWHPEMLREDPVQQKLFAAFVTACR